MNTNKLLVGTVVGFVGFFLGGFVLYTIVFKDLLASTNPGFAAAQKAPDMFALVIGNFAAAFLLAYVFEKWAGIRTLQTGAIAGAIIGLLTSLNYDSMMHGTSNLFTWTGVGVDTLVSALLWAIGGAVIGWFLGYKRN